MFTISEVWGTFIYSAEGGLFACVYMTIKLTHCLFTWHERGDVAYCLSQVGPGGQRRRVCGTCVCACMHRFTRRRRLLSQATPCGRSRGVWQISSPGRISVNEHFNHLCWMPEPAGCHHPPFPKINMEGHCWSGKALQRGVDSHQRLFFLALRQPNHSICWRFCHFCCKIW